jgi:hypothetical protein
VTDRARSREASASKNLKKMTHQGRFPHAKFQNPTIARYGRKVSEAEREKRETK